MTGVSLELNGNIKLVSKGYKPVTPHQVRARCGSQSLVNSPVIDVKLGCKLTAKEATKGITLRNDQTVQLKDLLDGSDIDGCLMPTCNL